MATLWLILVREFVSNVLTSRFVIGLFVCLLATVVVVFVQVADYEKQLIAYNTSLREAKVEAQEWDIYADIKPKAHRKPNPLRIFMIGMEKRSGDVLTIEPAMPAARSQVKKVNLDNPFLSTLQEVDIVFVFKILVSALVILFSYNTISGEREEGTLKLVLSNAISRDTFLLGKYLGGIFSLFPIVFISLGIALLVMISSPAIDLDGEDLARIVMIFAVSLLYVSTWYLLGMLLSVWTKTAATTLILSMFIWVILTTLHSNIVTFAISKFPPHEITSIYIQQINQLWGDFRKEREDYLKKQGYEQAMDALSWQEGVRQSTNVLTVPGFGFKEYYEIQSISQVKDSTRFQEILGYQEPLRIRYAFRAEEFLKELENTKDKNYQFTESILRISFADVYSLSIGAIAGTDRNSNNNFLARARNYKREIVKYLTDKEAFSSRAWFSSDQGRAQLAEMPVFQSYRSLFFEDVSRATDDIFILLGWNIILFMGGYISFLRYDMS